MPRLLRLATVATLLVAALPAPAGAGSPAGDAASEVPACVTASRLAAYLRARNPALDPRFATIAREYSRQGRDLGTRWDYAFFQMMVTTAALTFRRPDGTPARVRPEQNNFAGLGIGERGASGDAFPDLGSGVAAHLRRFASELEAGGDARPSAEAGEPAWLTALARSWAPEDRSYAATIEAVARRFRLAACRPPDPGPAEVAITTGAIVPPAPVPVSSEVAQHHRQRAREAILARRLAFVASPPARAALEAAPATAGPVAPTVGEPALPRPAAPGEAIAPDAAAGSPARTPPVPAAPLDPDERLRRFVAGRTVLLDTPIGTTIPIAFRSDGSTSGNAGSLASYLGAEKDEGRWWVERERLCLRWKVWFERETQCLKFRQAGRTIHWTSDKGKTGTARFARG